MTTMQIRIEGYDLPGLDCAASGNFPGYENIHVAVQRRNPRTELLGLTPGDASSVAWTLDCEVAPTAGGFDIKGPYIHGRPHERFIYLSWGSVDAAGAFSMFRRAKLWLDAVDARTLAATM